MQPSRRRGTVPIPPAWSVSWKMRARERQGNDTETVLKALDCAQSRSAHERQAKKP